MPAAQASGQRPPVERHRAAVLHQTNAFTNLGHEGSGRHAAGATVDAFTNLGHEGSGRRAAGVTVDAFTNLGHEGSGLAAAYEAAKLRPWAA